MRDSPVPEPVITSVDNDSSDGRTHEKKWCPKMLIQRVERSHSRLPFVRKIPFRALAIILLIALLNVVVWIAAAIVLVSFSRFDGLC